MTVPPIDSARAHALAPDFVLVREIGRGGMGVVYLAHDVKLDRDVAVKILPESLAADPGVRERFLREARTAARLSHPNIVPIYRADESEGVAFFVMGYVEGDSLADRLHARGALDAREVVPVLRDVALALGYAHARGVVHRDVKPANILLEQHGGRALVTDFGIARLVAASPLTATGQVLGTVHYMSPEQVSGDELDGRSDLYSLGIVAFEALAGRLPFENASAAAVLVAHVTRPAPALADVAPQVPRALAAIVDRCLHKDAAARFQTGAELAAALDAAARDSGAVPARAMARAAATPAPVETPVVIPERDAQALWKRAAELQAETGLQPAARSPVPPALHGPAGAASASLTSGYRLADVRGAAEEAGISARYVERAAAELGLAAADAPGTLAPVRVVDHTPARSLVVGAATTIVYETVVDGELAPDRFDELLDAITRAVGENGTVGSLGRSLRWSTATEKRKVQLSVIPRDGRTTIRVEENLSPLVGALFGGMIGGGGGGSGGLFVGVGMSVFHDIVIALGLWGTAILGTYAGARAIFKSKRASRARTLHALVEQLATIVASDDSSKRRRIG